MLATGGRDNTVYGCGTLPIAIPTADVRVLKGHDADILALAFNADASAIVSAGDDGTARLWRLDGDSNDGSSILQDVDSDGSVTALGWVPMGATWLPARPTASRGYGIGRPARIAR